MKKAPGKQRQSEVEGITLMQGLIADIQCFFRYPAAACILFCNPLRDLLHNLFIGNSDKQ